jgi:hypothetical protein
MVASASSEEPAGLSASLLAWSARQQAVLNRRGDVSADTAELALKRLLLLRTRARDRPDRVRAEQESSSSSESESEEQDEDEDLPPLPPPPRPPPLLGLSLKLPLQMIDSDWTPPDELESRGSQLKRFANVLSQIDEQLFLGSDLVARDLPRLRTHGANRLHAATRLPMLCARRRSHNGRVVSRSCARATRRHHARAQRGGDGVPQLPRGHQ